MKKLVLILSLCTTTMFGQFLNDVIINNAPTIDQSNVEVATAFNGWIYTAHQTVDAATNAGGITIKMSKDRGETWTVIDSYMPIGLRYPAHDIVVTGTDTNNLKLFLVGVREEVSSGNYIIFIDEYNARTGNFITSNFNENRGTNKVYSVSIDSDYLFPAVSTSPYSLGVLFSAYTSSRDSIIYIASLDAGATWGVRQQVATTGFYFGKVSIAYGKSASGSNGRYFGAWEQKSSASAVNSNIYTSRNTSQVDGVWNMPENIDSISSAAAGLCSNPRIAVSYGNTDNDSSSCTAIVLVDRDYGAAGNDHDVIGFYNKRAHFTDNWFRLDVENTSTNDMFPDIAFDYEANRFFCTYYDSTNKKQSLRYNDWQLTNTDTWTFNTARYNDDTTNVMVKSFPRISYNANTDGVDVAWTKKIGSGNGVCLFDASYRGIYIGIDEEKPTISINAYPNPTTDFVNLYAADLINYTNLSIELVDMQGRIIHQQSLPNAELHQINVSSFTNGLYLYRLKSNNELIYIGNFLKQ